MPDASDFRPAVAICLRKVGKGDNEEIVSGANESTSLSLIGERTISVVRCSVTKEIGNEVLRGRSRASESGIAGTTISYFV